MNQPQVRSYLKENLGFRDLSVKKLQIFHDSLLDYNSKYNLIAKSTESNIWFRHILDSAQLINYIDRKIRHVCDFGTGAGFPGLILCIFDLDHKFHVKLYEKSPIKCEFLMKMRDKLDINFQLEENVYNRKIKTDLIVARAFKKLNEILKISREMVIGPHKIIVLKGKSAQKEIKKVGLEPNYRYKLFKSITDRDSKILSIDAK
tara:strand:+ start:503 stop:1114 length:612 start_codon:yes stop_codon:yes gene_type:complete